MNDHKAELARKLRHIAESNSDLTTTERETCHAAAFEFETLRRPEVVTIDGPLGGFATIGRPAAELDLLLTQFRLEVETALDDDTSADDATYHEAEALKLKRQIIDRYSLSRSRGPYKVGEPEDEDGSSTVLNSHGEPMTADEIVSLLNTYSQLSVADFSALSPRGEKNHG